MKMVNQAGVGASLAGCMDFDDFTAAGRGSGLCPSAKRAPGSKRNGSLAIPQPAQVRCRECRGIITPVQFHSEETDLMHKSHSPSNGNRASPPQITPATDSYLELALAYAIESVLMEGGCYCHNLLGNGLAKNLSSLSTLLISCVGIPVSWCSTS